jgi:hypothetical protein
MRYTLSLSDGAVCVDNEKLIFYHFHNLKQIAGRIYDPGLRDLPRDAAVFIKRHIYKIYVDILYALTKEIEKTSNNKFLSLTVRTASEDREKPYLDAGSPGHVFRMIYERLRTIKKGIFISRTLLTGKYLPAFSSRRKHPYDIPLLP